MLEKHFMFCLASKVPQEVLGRKHALRSVKLGFFVSFPHFHFPFTSVLRNRSLSRKCLFCVYVKNQFLNVVW